jgi:hypothetical protein
MDRRPKSILNRRILKMEENKNVKVEEAVEVEVTEIEQGPTKKEKAINAAKKVGSGLWKTAKITAGAVGALVIGAVAIGTAIGAAKKGEPISEIPQEPIKPNDNEELNFEETTSEDSTIDVGLDV